MFRKHNAILTHVDDYGYEHIINDEPWWDEPWWDEPWWDEPWWDEPWWDE